MFRILKVNVLLLCLFVFLGDIRIEGITHKRNETEQLTNWDKVKQCSSAFFEYPSPENARLFMESLPRDNPTNQVGDRAGALDYIIHYDNYLILEREIWAGNRYSIEVAVRLLNLSDGAFTETILMTLGFFLRINPRLFLEIMIEYRETSFIKAMGCPCYMVEPPYFVLEKARVYELEMRQKAFESIKDTRLIEFREECIKALQKVIGGYKK